METKQQDQYTDRYHGNDSARKITIKGIITGVLILLMMIPTLFIVNLIDERESRQKEVAAEVSSRWAGSQVLSGPYLYIPYRTYFKNEKGQTQEGRNYFRILPENIQVTGKLNHEIRQRSIYKILLYRANLKNTGHFKIMVPANINREMIEWDKTEICYSLSDFKGIEEKLTIRLKDRDYELSPGIPGDDQAIAGVITLQQSANITIPEPVPARAISGNLHSSNFSSTIDLTTADIGKDVSFAMDLRIKGSGQLHFLPLGGNSKYSLQADWASPSFDGNSLPTDREITPQGFTASWSFNKANLPFGTILKEIQFNPSALAFGITLLQPADHYAKTSRSIKYAILFIGLTFALFFIVELLQKKPMHPVQYVLIGLALVIFYTLLLSISEFLRFNAAYLISALSTISLITLYAYGHFGKWRSAGLFGGVLTMLYIFIFVLVQLEDTALLVGSIGLFMILAAVMYASKKINWYDYSPNRVK
jgi:inner membrane protein